MHPIHLLVPVAWRSALGLAVLGSILGVAAPARAQIDIEEVGISLLVLLVNDAGSDSVFAVRARLFVAGTGITDATITPPGGSPIGLIETAPGEFLIEQSFADEAALTATLPEGDYLLDVNGGETTATLAYARPAVPSPRISSPLHQGVVAPGPVEVRFQPCAICVQGDDSTQAELASGDSVLASQVLPAAQSSWIPSDAAGPLALPPSSSFAANVVHAALRTQAVSATPADPFVFGSALARGDLVEFSTGFAAPEASLCIVVNDPAKLDPKGECALHEDLADAIFDTGGSFETTAIGVPIQYGFSVSPRGRLSGIADLDLDDDGSFETHVPVAGRLSGGGGRLRQSLRFGAASPLRAAETKLKVNVREETDTTAFLRTRVQTAKGRLGGARVTETISNTDPLDPEPRGWRLDFDVSDTQGEITDALLTLSNGRTIPLFGRHRFIFETNRTNVRLKSGGAERGVQIEIDTLALDAGGAIVRGVMRYRAFGQRGTIRFR
jgi:hypothetical protein